MMNARWERRLAQFNRAWVVVSVLAAFLAVDGVRRAAVAATLASPDQAAQVVSVRAVTVKDGAVSGQIVNNSSRTIRDVQLQIRYTWLWKNEMRPGEDSVSDTVYYTVEGDIPPGGNKPFTYKPSSPLPSRPDGRYEVTVSVAGFAELIPQK
jgi:hypothetical protein